LPSFGTASAALPQIVDNRRIFWYDLRVTINRTYRSKEKGMQDGRRTALILGVIFSGLVYLLGCGGTKTAAPPQEPPQTAAAAGGPEASAPAPLPANELPEGWQAFVEKDIFFERDSDALSVDAITLLQQKAAWLLANPRVRVVIQGHSDENGTAEYNLALGDHRAGKVKSFLIGQGVASGRLAVVSYGREKPLVAGADEAAKTRNRRVHIAIEDF
jgi:peptidoglycan-associated lipoprotein